MSNAALTWAFGQPLDSSGAKFVLVALADHATDHAGEDWTCFPSNERLCEFTSLPMRTLERHLSWLVAEGWITRTAERDGRGRMKDRRYRLHRHEEDRAALKASRQGGAAVVEMAEDDGETACPPANMAGGETDSPPAKNGAHHPPKTASPPANLAGGYIDEPPITLIEPSPGVRADAPGGERAAFNEIADLWGKTDPDRVAKPLAWPAWQKAALRCEGGEPALAKACRRYLTESGEVKRRHCRPMERWLAEDRWENWLGATRAERWGLPELATFADETIRKTVVTMQGEEFARSYLDRSAWDQASRTITAWSTFAAAKLRTLNNNPVWPKLAITVRDPESTLSPANLGDGR